MNEIELEIEVMQTVGQAFAQLSDPEAKRRVLAWMIDRFQPGGDVRHTPAPQSSASLSRTAPLVVDGAADTNLGVDGLAEFFDSPGATPVAKRDVAAVAAIDAQPGTGIEKLVQGFVSDFQKCALDWHGA